MKVPYFVKSRLGGVARLGREAAAYASLLTRRPPSTRRLLIFAQGRTGSTVLENLIASTGHFQERGELLGAHNERVRFPASYLKGRARLHASGNFLCHVKIYHLTFDRIAAGVRPVEPSAFLRALSDDGWKIVHLQRRDKFRHYVSGLIAKQRGAYHKFDATAEELRIVIDPQDLKRGLLNRRRLDQEERDALRGIPHLPLVYEDDLQHAEAQILTIRRLLDDLGLEDRPAQTRMQKINSRPQDQLIANYKDALRWASDLNAAP